MMRLENAIEVHNITKKFKVYYDKGHTLKEVVLFSKRRRYEEREILQGISFDVKKGEAVGLIGRNGCGKSTMLKLLTKIMYPNSGTIEMSGRVSSLIELGAGFHPDMSGRQNIYTNASIFGLSRKEINARLDGIIEFSGLHEYIDNPVRTYSSGMYMRLAFAVAINVDADILLIDEILTVGDVNFQEKCLNKLLEIKAMGTTIVIVSHSLDQIEKICERSIWIDEGKIMGIGSPDQIHPLYIEHMGEKIKNVQEPSRKELKINIVTAIEKMTITSGELARCPVEISNLSSFPFYTKGDTPFYLSYHILDETGEMIEWEGFRTGLLGAQLLSGETQKIVVHIRVPRVKDQKKYICRIMLLQENVLWIEKNYVDIKLQVLPNSEQTIKNQLL